MEPTAIMCTVIGDGGVGKSSMIITHTRGAFPECYFPSSFDTFNSHVVVDGKPYNLGLWDTAGQDDYDRLRPLSYPGTGVFLVLYSCVDPTSFKNVRNKWFPEIRHHCPDAPIVLAATKIDLLANEQIVAKSGQALVTFEQGAALAQEMGAAKFVEFSSLTQLGLKQCIDECIKASIAPKICDSKRTCTLF